MVKIVLGCIGLIFGLTHAFCGTVCNLCKSNIVGADEAKAADFMGDAEQVVFHEKIDGKY